jgi:hypothetical protein
VERGDRFWIVTVPGVGATQARHLRELEAMTTDLIQVMTGESDPAVSYDFRLPPEVRKHLARAEKLRTDSASAQAAAAGEVRAAARALRDQGIPLRDVGRLLGVSYQRAHQLTSA